MRPPGHLGELALCWLNPRDTKRLGSLSWLWQASRALDGWRDRVGKAHGQVEALSPLLADLRGPEPAPSNLYVNPFSDLSLPPS